MEKIQPLTTHLVAVIGAGPAGLFASRELAENGVRVFLFNRDIKPGGLAEYGIYPTKLRMKTGLRTQFKQILERDGIEYYGNVIIGKQGDFTLEQLKEMGFSALLVAVGAQGTKRLGIPGEDLRGVYHAKDIVYHYNRLPPYSEMTFDIGKRVAVIGVGNVMLDITQWLLRVRHVDEVIAVARRGPAEVKFDPKELEHVINCLDVNAVEMELNRVTPQMVSLGQDPNQIRALIRALLEKDHVEEGCGGSSFRLQFLASPVRILGDENGHVCGLEVEQTMLYRQENGEVVARGMGKYTTLDVDTVIFAIGDRVDPSLGLPVEGNEFVKNPQPRFPVEGISYEAYDPATQSPVEGVFVAGWARKASTGLVGIARKDGINAARAVLQYLKTLPFPASLDLDAIRNRILSLPHPVVTYPYLKRLEEAERQRAQELGVEDFKFEHNLEMLEAMGLIRSLAQGS